MIADLLQQIVWQIAKQGFTIQTYFPNKMDKVSIQSLIAHHYEILLFKGIHPFITEEKITEITEDKPSPKDINRR